MCYINELLLLKFPNKGEEYIAYELLFPNKVMNYSEVQNKCAFREASIILKKLKQNVSAVNNILFLIYSFV